MGPAVNRGVRQVARDARHALRQHGSHDRGRRCPVEVPRKRKATEGEHWRKCQTRTVQALKKIQFNASRYHAIGKMRDWALSHAIDVSTSITADYTRGRERNECYENVLDGQLE